MRGSETATSLKVKKSRRIIAFGPPAKYTPGSKLSKAKLRKRLR
jgi:hypothetical protein